MAREAFVHDKTCRAWNEQFGPHYDYKCRCLGPEPTRVSLAEIQPVLDAVNRLDRLSESCDRQRAHGIFTGETVIRDDEIDQAVQVVLNEVRRLREAFAAPTRQTEA